MRRSPQALRARMYYRKYTRAPCVLRMVHDYNSHQEKREIPQQKNGRLPPIPRTKMKLYKKYMEKATQLRRLAKYSTNHCVNPSGELEMDATAKTLARQCDELPIEHRLTACETTQWTQKVTEESQQNRREARKLIRKYHKDKSDTFKTNWREIMDKNIKLGHRCIFNSTQPRHRLTAVTTRNGQKSTKAKDILEHTEAHFTKVQTAQVTADPIAIKAVPWEKGDNPMKLRKARNITPLMTDYDEDMYMEHLRRLPNRKAAGPDTVTNEVLKAAPHGLHKHIAKYMEHIGKTGHTPNSWKLSHTVLLYKKGDPTYAKTIDQSA